MYFYEVIQFIINLKSSYVIGQCYNKQQRSLIYQR